MKFLSVLHVFLNPLMLQADNSHGREDSKMIPLFYVRLRNFALASAGEPVPHCRMERSVRRAVFSSIAFHFFLLVGLIVATSPQKKPFDSVKVKMVSVPVIPPKPINSKEKRKPEERKTVSERKVAPKALPAKAVQGLSPEALTPDASAIAAPLGNTLLTEDDGQRIRPEDYRDLGGDLSVDAKLVLSSVQVPKYTEMALEANLEGNFIVDVYVDELGNVLQSEVRKRIGFGMDERLLAAARIAKFQPRKNKFGRAEAGWAEIKFSLIIP